MKMLAAGAVALLFASAIPIECASAAPDQTRGMALLSLAIDLDGFVVSQSGVTNFTNVAGAGRYNVTFDRSVADCTAVGSIGPGNTLNPVNGTVVTGRLSGNPNGLLIQTRDDAGTLVDMAFSLLVFCPK